MKKLFFFTLIALIAIGVFFIKNTGPAKKIRIAYQSPRSMGSFPMFVAKQEKLFDKYNLPVDFIQITAGSEVSFANIFANPIKADYTPFAQEAIQVSQIGAPVKVVMVFSDSFPYYLISRPGLQLKDLKTISVDFPFTMQNYLILKFIDEERLSAKIIFSEKSIRGEKNIIDQKAMLMTRKIDATIVASPLIALAFQELGSGKPVLLKALREGLVGITATDEKIKNNPEEVKKIIKVMQSAIDFIQNNPEKTKELLFVFYNLDRKNEDHKKGVEKIYQIIKETFTNKGLPSGNSMRKSIQLIKAGGFKSAKDVEKQVVAPEDLAKTFDFQFLK